MMTVISGPPCAGKTTWIREHATPGDIVIDLDDLIAALGGDSHNPTNAVLRVAQAARIAAIRSATGRHREGCTVWVIDTDPPPWLRLKYRQAGAEIITITADADVLHQRARSAGRPQRVHGVIDDWLASHRTGDAAAGGRSW